VLAANPADPRHQEYAENAIYFFNRAQNYVHMFDPAIQFFQGKTAAGVFERGPADYDPRVWGNGYTETDGWNTAFDLTYDGRGLATCTAAAPSCPPSSNRLQLTSAPGVSLAEIELLARP
jgi:putative alpha-1,2-mannosidase